MCLDVRFGQKKGGLFGRAHHFEPFGQKKGRFPGQAVGGDHLK